MLPKKCIGKKFWKTFVQRYQAQKYQPTTIDLNHINKFMQPFTLTRLQGQLKAHYTLFYQGSISQTSTIHTAQCVDRLVGRSSTVARLCLPTDLARFMQRPTCLMEMRQIAFFHLARLVEHDLFMVLLMYFSIRCYFLSLYIVKVLLKWP